MHVIIITRQITFLRKVYKKLRAKSAPTMCLKKKQYAYTKLYISF